jgi:hypothetical protein
MTFYLEHCLTNNSNSNMRQKSKFKIFKIKFKDIIVRIKQIIWWLMKIGYECQLLNIRDC